MPEEETVYSSKIKYDGIVSFKDFYQFCYDWLTEDMGLGVSEDVYSEKIAGTSKNIDVEWSCSKKVTDYFKNKVKVKFKVVGLNEVEVMQGGVKTKTNKGSIEVSAKSVLQRDYEGKFEGSAFQKFLRAIYEKWIIAARVDEFEGRLASATDSFLGQAKAFLDLEGRK